jgi:hypothetical protein
VVVSLSLLGISRYLIGRSPVVKITVEVPESLVGDIYLAVGRVLELAQYEQDEATGLATPNQRDDDDEHADEA